MRSVLPACTAPSPRSIAAGTGAGPVWPQLAYLLWLAGAPVADTSVRGAETSGLSEFWDPDDGTGLGASPQSWTCLAIVMSRTSSASSASDVECWCAVAARAATATRRMSRRAALAAHEVDDHVDRSPRR